MIMPDVVSTAKQDSNPPLLPVLTAAALKAPRKLTARQTRLRLRDFYLDHLGELRTYTRLAMPDSARFSRKRMAPRSRRSALNHSGRRPIKPRRSRPKQH